MITIEFPYMEVY